jgi:hypothetical protein
VAGNRTTSAAITVSVVANPFVNLGVNAGVDVSPYSADAVPGEPSGQSTIALHRVQWHGVRRQPPSAGALRRRPQRDQLRRGEHVLARRADVGRGLSADAAVGHAARQLRTLRAVRG